MAPAVCRAAAIEHDPEKLQTFRIILVASLRAMNSTVKDFRLSQGSRLSTAPCFGRHTYRAHRNAITGACYSAAKPSHRDDQGYSVVDSTNKERIVDGRRPGTARPLPQGSPHEAPPLCAGAHGAEPIERQCLAVVGSIHAGWPRASVTLAHADSII
jgi:hypothetical protein